MHLAEFNIGAPPTAESGIAIMGINDVCRYLYLDITRYLSYYMRVIHKLFI